MNKFTVAQIEENYKELGLELLAGKAGLGKAIVTPEINRPGLSLTGFFEYFASDRVQIFGKGEWAYLNSLDAEGLANLSSKFFSYNFTCLIFTHGNLPRKEWLDEAEKMSVPVFVTEKSTSIFVTLISQILNRNLAPMKVYHGVLIEIFGIGVLLQGKSGVGKSETALELIERGHRLVADDYVEIRRISESYLVGSCHNAQKHFMEIRGLGILNIQNIFGAGAIKDEVIIELVIHIEESVPGANYDRTGLDEKFETILEVNIPSLTIPVKPGRNIPILLETAAMNHRLKKQGINSAREFSTRIAKLIEEAGDL